MQNLFRIGRKAQLIALFVAIFLFGFFNFQILKLPQQQASVVNGSKSEFVQYPKDSKDVNKSQTRPKPMHNEEDNKAIKKPCKNQLLNDSNCFNFIFKPNIVEDKVFYQSDLLFLGESIDDIATLYYSSLSPENDQSQSVVCATEVKKVDDKVFLINFFFVNKSNLDSLDCINYATKQFPKTYKFTRVNENNGEFEELVKL